MLHTLTKLTKEIGLLTIALTIALMANFAYSAWSQPTCGPTGCNTAPPLNAGTVTQIKDSGLDLNFLKLTRSEPSIYFHDTSAGDMDVRLLTGIDGLYFQHNLTDNVITPTWQTTMLLKNNADPADPDYARIFGQVRADQFCDANGENCVSVNGLNGSDGSNCSTDIQEIGQCVTQISTATPPSCPAGYTLTGSYSTGNSCLGGNGTFHNYTCSQTTCSGTDGNNVGSGGNCSLDFETYQQCDGSGWSTGTSCPAGYQLTGSYYTGGDCGENGRVIEFACAQLQCTGGNNNEESGADVSSVMGEIGSTGVNWPDIITCNTNGSAVGAGALFYVSGGVYSDLVSYKFSDNMENSGNEVAIMFNKSNGSFNGAQGVSADCTNRSVQNFISAGEAFYHSSGWTGLGGALPVKYAWQLDEVTACTAGTPPPSCHGTTYGTITYNVYCASSANPSAPVDESNCTAPKPASVQACANTSTEMCGP